MSVTAQGRDSSYPYSHQLHATSTRRRRHGLSGPRVPSFSFLFLSLFWAQHSLSTLFVLLTGGIPPVQHSSCPAERSTVAQHLAGLRETNGAGQRRVERIAKKGGKKGEMRCVGVDRISWPLDIFIPFLSGRRQTLPALLLPDVRRCVCIGLNSITGWKKKKPTSPGFAPSCPSCRLDRLCVCVNVDTGENTTHGL